MGANFGSYARELVDGAIPSDEKEPSRDFRRCARYHKSMDMVIYLSEDCSYSAERVDARLTLLWHPSEEKVVGIKLKGFRHIFLTIKERYGLTEQLFLPLVQVLEAILTAGGAEEMMREQKQKYELAKQIAKWAVIEGFQEAA